MVETETLQAESLPQPGLLLDPYNIISGIWSNYRKYKAPPVFLMPGLGFLGRGEGESTGRWEGGDRQLANHHSGPVPWFAEEDSGVRAPGSPLPLLKCLLLV